MEKAPALDPMPLYESCMVAFYRGAPAPGAPVVPTPLTSTITNLSVLDLSHNPLGISGLQILHDIVCSGVLANLKMLQLQGSLSNDESTDKAFIEVLSTNCPLLMEVNLSENNLSSQSVIMTLARVVSFGSQI